MLNVNNIVKQYATHLALDDVSLSVEQGKIFGLLGPNGAGKTSLIRIITQITAPDSGEVIFNGQRLNASHISQIGYLPEERGLYKKMEIGEQVMYLAKLKGMSSAEATKRVRYWFEKLEMGSWWNKKVEDLSKGMQQKVQFVATVLHEPELIILDEPFSGFDPVNADIIKNEILELNKQGATFIFSTHRMESVEELCDSIALIHHSKKILDGSVAEIKEKYRNNTYWVEYDGEYNPVSGAGIFDVLQKDVHKGKTTLKVQLMEGKTANELLSVLLPVVNIHRLDEVIPTMNDIFIDQVKQKN
ncbi:ABC-2 type transport system ATP-binding protein [Pedobacter cryoconitis]|uniref:ABC-2 type transport system ATP-binding protein n=1 Tax=Pedobacter cryoconitis TaxID=188932 RepID=A0A7W8ZS98_9SPHI|nr:ABC transporter ATP-binding protein [Pedobacter cryoconitis]MBB5639267.1 ABC-2 type transport system ATP-binding protein [Pedobacter cryoconitis]MBB6269666.1 ABC-2 type transport system ATP-binding protein [Pedobacter cryoconitis]